MVFDTMAIKNITFAYLSIVFEVFKEEEWRILILASFGPKKE